MNPQPNPPICCEDPSPSHNLNDPNQVHCPNCLRVIALCSTDDSTQPVWKSPDGTTRYETTAIRLEPPYLLPHHCDYTPDAFCMACLRQKFKERNTEETAPGTEDNFEPPYDEIYRQAMVILDQEDYLTSPDFIIPQAQRI